MNFKSSYPTLEANLLKLKSDFVSSFIHKVAPLYSVLRVKTGRVRKTEQVMIPNSWCRGVGGGHNHKRCMRAREGWGREGKGSVIANIKEEQGMNVSMAW